MDYAEATKEILAICHGETDAVALMATLACEIHARHPMCDWTGFYRVVAPELLKIGPYQGGHGCLVIPFARGVCGACARTGQVQNVPDVDAFPGHIACSSSTRSELVLPVWNGAGRSWVCWIWTATPRRPLPAPMKIGWCRFWPMCSGMRADASRFLPVRRGGVSGRWAAAPGH